MNIEAFVIKKIPVREHDQMVVLYSRTHGKQVAIAKGSLRVHSKQALALDDGNYIQCELIEGRAGYIMTGAQAVRSYSVMKSSGVRLAAGNYFLQIMDVLVYDGQPDEQIWACLADTLSMLDAASDDDVLPLVRNRQRAFLEALGYGLSDAPALSVRFDELAQRRLTALDVLYAMVGRPIS